MNTTYGHQIEIGTDVYGSDDEKIGTVAAIADNYFVIEKGFLFTTDVYVPMHAVSGVADDRVTLSMTKDQVNDEDWSSEPMGDDTDYAGEVYGRTDADNRDLDRAGSSDADVLERREERLVVDKDVEQAGAVSVGKHVVEDRQSVDVPVTREEVTIDRRSVDRPATGDSLSEDSIEVPVYEERVSVDKEARVVEELEIGKTSVSDTERVEETVRREEFDIDGDTGTTRNDRQETS